MTYYRAMLNPLEAPLTVADVLGMARELSTENSETLHSVLDNAITVQADNAPVWVTGFYLDRVAYHLQVYTGASIEICKQASKEILEQSA